MARREQHPGVTFTVASVPFEVSRFPLLNNLAFSLAMCWVVGTLVHLGFEHGTSMLSSRVLVMLPLLIALYMGSSLLHEVGHLLVARALGLSTGAVRINSIGWSVQVTSPNDLATPRYRARLWVAVAAGPATEFVLGVVTAVLGASTGQHQIVAIAAVILVSSAGNLIPIKRFDGWLLLTIPFRQPRTPELS